MQDFRHKQTYCSFLRFQLFLPNSAPSPTAFLPSLLDRVRLCTVLAAWQSFLQRLVRRCADSHSSGVIPPNSLSISPLCTCLSRRVCVPRAASHCPRAALRCALSRDIPRPISLPLDTIRAHLSISLHIWSTLLTTKHLLSTGGF